MHRRYGGDDLVVIDWDGVDSDAAMALIDRENRHRLEQDPADWLAVSNGEAIALFELDAAPDEDSRQSRTD